MVLGLLELTYDEQRELEVLLKDEHEWDALVSRCFQDMEDRGLIAPPLEYHQKVILAEQGETQEELEVQYPDENWDHFFSNLTEMLPDGSISAFKEGL